MSFCLSPFTPPWCRASGQKGGVAPSTSTPLVRRADAPGEAGDTQAGVLLRLTAEDSGNPFQPASNKAFQAKLSPQRGELRPLIVQCCGCQTRAPPG